MRVPVALRGGDEMGRKHHKPEEIVGKLQQVEGLTAHGVVVWIGMEARVCPTR